MKFLLSRVLLFTFLIFSLISCEKEEDINTSLSSNLTNQDEFDIEVKSLDLFLDQPELKVTLDKINNRKSILKSNISIYNFEISKKQVKKIKSKTITTYTFFIKRKKNDPNNFENLVIRFEKKKKPEAFLLTYTPSEAIKSGTIHDSFTFKGDIDIQYLDYNKIKGLNAKSAMEECSDVLMLMCSETGLGESGTNYTQPHVANTDCNDWGFKYYEWSNECYSVDDGSGGGEPGGPAGSGGGGTIPTSPTGDLDCDDPVHGCDKEPLDVESLSLQELVLKLEECVPLNYQDKDWLLTNDVDSKHSRSLVVYTEQEGCSQDAVTKAKDYIKIIKEIPDAKLERYLELVELLEDEPWELVEECMQQNGLSTVNYLQLYNHTLPQSCVNVLNSRTGFQDQPLNTGNAAVANVDYYGVEITTNPDFNLDGTPDTDAEVFAVYRSQFTDWATGSKDDFQFSCDVPFDDDDKGNINWSFSPYYSSDATIWNSSNPVTAIIRIHAGSDILGGALISDHGAIMISDYTSQYWIGSTIETTQTGTQPFSGNRQWGFHTNQNGNLELYTRAVDVARVSDLVLYGPSEAECKEETYYNIGDETWSNLQEQIEKWISINGGVATIVPKTTVRFDKTKLKEQLESNQTIDQINCN